MKVQIIFFLLATLFIYSRADDLPTGYFYLIDSSASTNNALDGRSQFFDFNTGLDLEIPLNLSAPSRLFWNIENFLIRNLSIPSNRVNHVKILNAKAYWRDAGYLPLKLVTDEMALSNADKMHVADLEATMLSVQYLFYNMPIPPEQNPYRIKHEVLEVCAQVQGRDFRHFVVDRAYNGIFPDTWNTRVRLIYTGKSTTCDLTDSAWADKRAGTWNNNGVVQNSLTVVDQAPIQSSRLGEDYDLEDLVEDIELYFKNFPVYNTLYNCQHFGSNLYNHITGRNTTFISSEVMVLTVDGVSNLPKLIFSFDDEAVDGGDDD